MAYIIAYKFQKFPIEEIKIKQFSSYSGRASL